MALAVMPWVRFIKPFDFVLHDKAVLHYRANRDYLVKQACAKQAVEKQCAVLIDRPQREASENASRKSSL